MTVSKAEQLVAHQLAYSFLSKAYYELPEAEFINLLAEQRLFDEWLLGSDDESTKVGLELLKSFCEQWDDTQLVALNTDYTRLFIGPGAMFAPPWESVYRSAEHLIFDKQTLQVRQRYQAYGMPIPKLHVEPEDHFGLELRFVAYLCNLGINALEQNRGDQLLQIEAEVQSFLRDHVLQWSEALLSRVIEKAQTDYYRGIAYLTRGCLAQTSRAFGKQPLEATP